MNFKPLTDTGITLFMAGVESANPEVALKNYLTRDENNLIIVGANGEKKIYHQPQVKLISFGKAGCTMANYAQQILTQGKNLMVAEGIVVTNVQNVQPIPNCQVFGASHPIPDNNGYEAAKKIAEFAKNAQDHELVLVLISGGGSALIPHPPESVSL